MRYCTAYKFLMNPLKCLTKPFCFCRTHLNKNNQAQAYLVSQHVFTLLLLKITRKINNTDITRTKHFIYMDGLIPNCIKGILSRFLIYSKENLIGMEDGYSPRKQIITKGTAKMFQMQEYVKYSKFHNQQ